MIEKRPRPFLSRYARDIYYAFANPIRWTLWRFTHPKTYGAKMVLTRGDHFLLVRIGYGHRKWTWPGGQRDKGEAAKDAAIRELREETKIVVSDAAYIGTLENSQYHNRDTTEYFTAESPTDHVIIDDQEIIDAGWFTRDSVPHECTDRVEKALAFYDNYRNQHA